MYSDMILTPVSDKPYDLMGLRKYEEILKELSSYNAMKKTYIVFNNINPSMKNFGNLIEFILSSRHYILMVSVLRQRSDISYSVSYGKSVNEYSPKSKSAQEVNELVSEIKEILAIA